MTSKTVEVWDRFEAAQAKIEKLQRRAAKLGLVLKDQVHGYHVIERSEPDHTGRRVKVRHEVVELGFSLPTIRLAGWRFLAAVDHAPHLEECVVRGLPGHEDSGISLAGYATAKNTCDHCRRDRARKTTYVVHHEDGRLMRVGSTCLRDFMGVDPKRALACLRFADGLDDAFEDDEGWGSMGHGEAYHGSLNFLSAVAHCIRTVGWVSGGQAYADWSGATISTRQEAECYLRNLGKPKDRFRGQVGRYEDERTEQDHATAKDALAWGAALGAEETAGNDYMTNLRVVCSADVYTDAHAGILASVVSTHLRHLEQEVNRARAAEKTNEHLGAVGDRIDVQDVTIVSLRYLDGDYGVTTLVKFEDPGGRLLVWFASGEKEFEVGQAFPVLRGRVKAHAEFMGRLETRMTRCTFPKK